MVEFFDIHGKRGADKIARYGHKRLKNSEPRTRDGALFYAHFFMASPLQTVTANASMENPGKIFTEKSSPDDAIRTAMEEL